MDPKHHPLFLDERLTGMCAYCGAQPDTRDHVPSKALLNEPFPPQLMAVRACASCNGGFSLDEQYLACLLECVLSGTVEPSDIGREKIKRILNENAALKARIEASRRQDATGSLVWQPEPERVRRIITKLARGHAAYELYPQLEEPEMVAFTPFQAMSDQERAVFEETTSRMRQGWPEIGSRALYRASGENPDGRKHADGWDIVQPGRYRYCVVEADGVLVRIVLSEYLACAVSWGPE